MKKHLIIILICSISMFSFSQGEKDSTLISYKFKLSGMLAMFDSTDAVTKNENEIKKAGNRAINFCNEFLMHYPKEYDCFFERGRFKERIKDYNGAISDYDLSLKNNPYTDTDYFLSLLYKARIEIDLEKYADALIDYDKLIKYDSTMEFCYVKRAFVKNALNDSKGVIADCDRAIKLEASDVDAYWLRGSARYTLKDFIGAIADFNKVIELTPKYKEAYSMRGNAKLELKDYRGSVIDYNQVILLDPKDELAYFNRGLAKYNLKDNLGALKDFNKAIEINPKMSVFYLNRGLVKDALKDINGSCLDWSRAGELGEARAYELIKKYCNN